MPSDAPVAEVFDIFGKMGTITIEILRLLRDRNRNKNILNAEDNSKDKSGVFGDMVKNMAKKHFGTGEVGYSKLLKAEGLENVSHKTIPVDKLDDFEQIAKEVGLPYSVCGFNNNTADPAKSTATIAYAKRHEDAFSHVMGAMGAKEATAAQIQMAAVTPDRNPYEDVAMEAPANIQDSPADVLLFGFRDEQQYSEGIAALRSQGVNVFQARNDLPPEALKENPELMNHVGILRADYAKACQAFQQHGVMPSTDAIIIPQSSTYRPSFETIRHQQAYEKRMASQTQEEVTQAPQQAVQHYEATNLYAQQLDAVQKEFAANDIAFGLSYTQNSNIGDLLIAEPDLAKANEIMADLGIGRGFREVSDAAFEQLWVPGHQAEITRMDISAQDKIQRGIGSVTQENAVIGEYMMPDDPALQPFRDAAAVSAQGNLGPRDFTLMTKGDQEIEVIPMDAAQFQTFTRTVGADVPYAASAAGGTHLVAWNAADKSAVENAVKQAAPGLHPVRVMPEEHQMDRVPLKKITDANKAENWAGEQPVPGTRPLNELVHSAGGKPLKTFEASSADFARLIAEQAGQDAQYAISPGQNGSVYITFPESEAAGLQQRVGVLRKAKDISTDPAERPHKDFTDRAVNSGRSLRDRARNPMQKNQPQRGKATEVVSRAKDIASGGIRKATEAVKKATKRAAQAVGIER